MRDQKSVRVFPPRLPAVDEMRPKKLALLRTIKMIAEYGAVKVHTQTREKK